MPETPPTFTVFKLDYLAIFPPSLACLSTSSRALLPPTAAAITLSHCRCYGKIRSNFFGEPNTILLAQALGKI